MSETKIILIVDDEPMLCDIFSEVLCGNHHRVLTATNGKEALKILKREPVDLLITDVMMPEVDGYQLAAQVRELYPNTIVQLMSGFNENGNQHLVPGELIRRLLSKPVDLTMLINRVSELLH